MWTILKKFPWWVWVAGIIGIFLIWQSATGAAFSNKMWHMVKDQLVSDQSNIIAVKEEQEKWYESEIAKLNDKIAQIQKDKALLAQDIAKSKVEIARLTGRINELQNQIDNIIVGNDPDSIIRDLQRRFPSIKRK